MIIAVYKYPSTYNRTDPDTLFGQVLVVGSVWRLYASPPPSVETETELELESENENENENENEWESEKRKEKENNKEKEKENTGKWTSRGVFLFLIYIFRRWRAGWGRDWSRERCQ